MGDEARFRLSRTPQAIVDMLTDVLAAGVVLYDADAQTHYLAMREGRWIAHRSATWDAPRACYVHARVNDRWTLYVCSGRGLHPDAESIAAWAADKLAVHLPKRADEPTYPPIAGGGSGGSAALGIPVWWARKARN